MGNGERRKNHEDLAQKIARSSLFHDFVDRVTALKIIGQADVAMHAFGDSPHWAYVLGNKVLIISQWEHLYYLRAREQRQILFLIVVLVRSALRVM